MRYIDFHCDTLMKAWLRRKKDICVFPKAMVDIQRLQSSGCAVQFFAIFMPPIPLKRYFGPLFPKDEQYIRKNVQIFQRTVQQCGSISHVWSSAEVQANKDAGKISGILTLEDGRAVNGDLENLNRFYELGIRLISLTWNHANCFGSPNSTDPHVMAQGLTSFGKDAVAVMNDLGILVDVSHLSDGGFWDVAEQARKPFVASHSNCRALVQHPRNLSDEMIRTVADSGGVVGLNFGPEFLTNHAEPPKSTAEKIALHARHLANCGGIGCVAIGSDFDGISGDLEISSADQMNLLFQQLDRCGFSTDEIEKIAYRNALRVINDTLS